MIGKLTGILDSVESDHLILDVGGVGYLIYAPQRLLRTLALGSAASFHIETQLREESLRLYGFASRLDLQWFTLLQTVQGVGARVALAVLSDISPEALAVALATGDKSALSKVSGIGPKLATRLVTELKDKLPTGSFAIATQATDMGTRPLNPGAADALSALIALGYQERQARETVMKILAAAQGELDPAALIRACLQELAR